MGQEYGFGQTFTNPADIGGTGSGFDGYISATTSFDPDAATLWQFDIGYDPYGNGQNNLIAHPGRNLLDITSTVNTPVMYGPFTGTELYPVGVFTASGTTTIGSPDVTFATTIAAIGPGVSVSGTGIPPGTTVLSALEVGGIDVVGQLHLHLSQ